MQDTELRCNVLVLGAGTSKDFGLPIGSEVLDAAIERVERLKTALDKDEWPFNPDEMSSRAFGKYSDINFKLAFHSNGQFDIDKFFRFSEELVDTHCETLDNFAFEHVEFSPACRYLTSAILVENLYLEEHGYFRPITLTRRLADGGRRNWIDRFISVARSRIRNGEVAPWAVINFNYDFIFESRLRAKWQSTGAHNIGDVDKHFEFIHPHGRFLFQESTKDLSKLVVSYANDITYVHETNRYAEPLNIAFSRVSNAWNIYIMGFACAQENARLIGLIDNLHRSPDTVIYAQNFSGNRTYNERFERAGVKDENVYTGYCDAIIDDSFFGDVPV